MNDRERENWVNNDEGLYRWRQSQGRKSMREFIRDNREEIDAAIDRVLNPSRDRGFSGARVSMTKKEATRDFTRYVRDSGISRRDKPALREAWNDYTDSLQKNGLITARQYDTWTQPKGLEGLAQARLTDRLPPWFAGAAALAVAVAVFYGVKTADPGAAP